MRLPVHEDPPMSRKMREPVEQGRTHDTPLIDAAEFARLLGCSVKHVRRMADLGRCPPPVRLGGLVRWTRAEIDAWIADGCPSIRRVRIGGAR
jgi:prophage regulatory protein